MRISKKSLRMLAVGFVAGLALTGCSTTSGGETSAPPSSDPAATVETVTIGVIPTADQGAFFHGVSTGVFEEVGLDVEVKLLTSASALIAALSSGEVDLVSTAFPTLAQSIAAGLPFKTFVQHSQMPDSGYMEVIVPEDSDIESFADLEGGQVGIVAAQGIFELVTRAAVAEDGGDPDAVEWVGLPPTENLGSIDSGRLAAAAVSEPWLAGALASGKYRSLGSPAAALDYPVPSAVIAATTSFVDANPSIIEKYIEGIRLASEQATSDPDLARAALGEYVEMSPEVLAGISLPLYINDIDVDSAETILAAMFADGWLEKELKPSDILVAVD